MFINITDSATANNKGSSGGLVNYLEKENKLNQKELPEYWFNNDRQNIQPFEVRHSIDNNVARLCKSDAKFFLVNISPSQKEIKHLYDSFGKNGAKDELKKYAEKVMDEYAKNFKRAGINSSKDLVWFAKLEKYRYYNHQDKEVKNGTKQRGERKEGKQIHIQVIVSRKDVTNKIKLSPMNNSRGKNEKHSLKLGQFNRVAFKQCGETLFDKKFGFERKLNESMAFSNINKNGDMEQKVQLDFLREGAKMKPGNLMQAKALINEVSNGVFNSVLDMMSKVDIDKDNFLEILLEPSFDPFNNEFEKEENRRIRKQLRGQGLGR
ncbi:MAG: molybdopterin-guanine dinucleotide biosynthesis protein MobB [Flavobacterium sp.]|nr:molybdopterin-guanine dinucleotide biosynthesis protein MobB [Pedobacter sp.]